MTLEDSQPPQKQVSVALRGQYYWGPSSQQALGLITTVSLDWIDVHTSNPPPEASEVKVRFSLSAKTGTVEAYGTSYSLPDQKLNGFRLMVRGFQVGESILAEFLGVDSSALKKTNEAQPSFIQEKRAAPRIAVAQMLRIGTDTPNSTAVIVDISESGLYCTISAFPGGERWKPGQILKLEIFVPVGPKTLTHSLTGSIVRVDEPGKVKNSSNWGIAIQFQPDSLLSPDILQRIARHIGVYYPTPTEGVPKLSAATPIQGVEKPGAGRADGSSKGGSNSQESEAPRSNKPPLIVVGVLIVLFGILLYYLTMRAYEARLDAVFGPRPTPRSTPAPSSQ